MTRRPTGLPAPRACPARARDRPPDRAVPTRVTAILDDGRRIAREVDDVPGFVGRPMQRANVEWKFRGNVGRRWPEGRTAAVLQALWAVADQSKMRMQALPAARAAQRGGFLSRIHLFTCQTALANASPPADHSRAGAAFSSPRLRGAKPSFPRGEVERRDGAGCLRGTPGVPCDWHAGTLARRPAFPCDRERAPLGALLWRFWASGSAFPVPALSSGTRAAMLLAAGS